MNEHGLTITGAGADEFYTAPHPNKRPYLPFQIVPVGDMLRLCKNSCRGVLERHRHLNELIGRAEPSVEAMMTILSSHSDLPEAEEKRISIYNNATSVSLVGVPRERKLYIADAPVCFEGYREYTVSF